MGVWLASLWAHVSFGPMGPRLLHRPSSPRLSRASDPFGPLVSPIGPSGLMSNGPRPGIVPRACASRRASGPFDVPSGLRARCLNGPRPVIMPRACASCRALCPSVSRIGPSGFGPGVLTGLGPEIMPRACATCWAFVLFGVSHWASGPVP